MNKPRPSGPRVDWSLVTRVVDRLIPEDDYPSASQAGVIGRLASGSADENRELWTSLLGPGFAALRRELGNRDLDAVTDEELDRLLARVASGRTERPWPVSATAFRAELMRVTAEQFYGSHGAAGWHMVGFHPALRRSGGLPPEDTAPLTTCRIHELGARYDAIVVGIGAGGGIAAAELAVQGLAVLAVDRGEYLFYEQVGKDHLRNFRLSRYGHNTPPSVAAGPRVRVDSEGTEQVIEHPWDTQWSALPQTVGGGTRVYQGMAWRLLPADFELATRYGIPEASSLADWPIEYDDLEPYYSEIEWQ